MSASVAVVNAAGMAARHAANTVSRYYDAPGPSRLHHTWHNSRPNPPEHDLVTNLEPYDAQIADAEMEQLLTGNWNEASEQSPTATHDEVFEVTTPTNASASEASAATPRT